MAADHLHDRLDRFKSLIADTPATEAPSRYARLAEAMRGQLVRDEAGSYCLVKTLYPFGHFFGREELEETDGSRTYPRAAFSAGHEHGTVAGTSMLFLDTETTGLGGAGVVPFLIGCGSLTEEGFEVRQYLLPDYPDEAAMLERIMQEVTDRPVIVSYNGTAFDMSLLRDRMIVNRVAREIKTEGHLDLLHSTRRLFKRRLGDCSLTNIERELFYFHRFDDIPGYLIPSVYFEWLSEENLDLMPSVLEHNRLDILALYFLVEKIASAFESEGETLRETEDVYSLSRVFDRRKDNKRVLELCRKINDSADGELSNEILLFHSFALKRAGQWEQALAIWEKLSDCDSREGYLANLELAKFFEHKDKDHQRAFRYASRARKFCPDLESHRRLLEKRLSRLQTRLNS